MDYIRINSVAYWFGLEAGWSENIAAWPCPADLEAAAWWRAGYQRGIEYYDDAVIPQSVIELSPRSVPSGLPLHPHR